MSKLILREKVKPVSLGSTSTFSFIYIVRDMVNHYQYYILKYQCTYTLCRTLCLNEYVAHVKRIN